jgi:nucleotide-binding universal stress UspA family protein
MSQDKKNSILVPIDSTEQTIVALRQSYNLARYTNSQIVLLHVFEEDETKEVAYMQTIADDVAKESGLTVKVEYARGNVFAETMRLAEELNATLVVLGLTSHMSAKDIIGKSAFKFIRESKFPVLTVRGKQHRDGCENILLPLDLTKETRQKVDKAIEFAKYFGAAIRILSIFSLKDAEYENKILAYSQQVKNYIKSKGIPCTNKSMASDDIAEAVVEYGHKIEADLIMIMTKAELNIKEMFVGTTAQRVVDISDIPVLSLRPEDLTNVTFTPY